MSTVTDFDLAEENARLRKENAELKARIAHKGIIDKAKGWLQERLGMSEPESHYVIQRLACGMNAHLHEGACEVEMLIDAVKQVEIARAKRRNGS